jgi:hypothetical protein
MISTLIATLALLAPTAPKTAIALSLMPSEPLTEETYLGALRDELRLGVEAEYISVKWSDLEGEKPFDPKPFQDATGISKLLGGDVVVCIKPIDTNVKCVPVALQMKPFDDPQLLSQWENMLQKVIPLLPKNLKAVSFGNEVDVYLAGHPEEINGYLAMVKTARTLFKGAGIKAPVGVITTFDGLQRKPDLVKQIQSNFDVTMMTYYPMTQNFDVIPSSAIPSHFDEMLSVAGSKPLILTELGCPAGEKNKSSEDIQAEFVKGCFAQLEKHSAQIPFANFYQQSDFPAQMVDMFEIYYQLKDDKFRSMLSTIGLKAANGKPRKAYYEFRKLIRAWNEG